MIDGRHHLPGTKISDEFAARLKRLAPGEKVRVILMLDTPDASSASEGGPRRRNRQEARDLIHNSAERALGDIDGILKRFDGQRLAESPSVLGTIPVEATAAGIAQLGACKHVKAILEDQPISLLR